MKLSLFISTFLSACLLARPSSSVPTQHLPKHSAPIPRSCIIERPDYMGFIEKQDPTHRAANGSYFLAWKDPNVISSRPIPNGLDIDTLFQFSNIPSNAWGCQLELIFPKGYWALLGLGGGANKLYVYRVNDPIPPNMSWSTAPQPAYLFGVTPNLPTDQAMKEDMNIVINSASCQPRMTFRVAIAPEANMGGVEFWKDSAFPTAGFRMTHNC